MTEQGVFAIVYGIGWAFVAVIRIPYRWRARTIAVVDDRKTGRERALLTLVAVGMGVLPLLHILTPWLRLADYQPPTWTGWAGAAVLAAAVLMLWRSHVALGRNWSDSLQVRAGHRLITGGIYRYIRHPMYAFGWLFGIAQALLSPNWIAGLSGVASFAVLYRARVPREEQMMLDQFGDDYRAYMNRTGRVLPRRPGR